MKRVLVATWGNPFQWGEIAYRVDCKELGLVNCENVEMRNVSTLPVLIKALNPDKVIILALDTLANLTLKNEVPARELNSYNDVKNDVEERVRWFIENRVKPNLDEDSDLLNDEYLSNYVDVVVLPGLGEFDNASVRGDLLDFYSMVLKELAERLPEDDAEVFLDLTHGINFMPVLTYRALTDLLGLLAYLHTARLHVLNSEPYPAGARAWREEATETLVLNIRSVESTELRPKPIYSVISGKPGWSAFISSVTNGFPLAFAVFYPYIAEVRGYIDGELERFLDSIEVEMRPDSMGARKVHVERKLALSRDFRTAVKLYYMLRVFNTTFRGYPKRNRDGVSLDELLALTRRLFYAMPRIGIVVEDQLCTMKDVLSRRGRSIKEKGWEPLMKAMRADSFSGGSSQSLRHGGSVSEKTIRNFIAHAGFEFNLTMFRKFGGEFLFKYSDVSLARTLAVEALKMRRNPSPGICGQFNPSWR
ncbi:CRISPR-associated CARF protein Csx1 [Thermococcus sp. JdF3]|uniref:CRISPR-associated CARF protein Csx1 n=1 Tax=Thermococcus sp. JdF3 TaxID=1638258 RepID=UPI001438BC50|nr:CRISPR-associated CARF protein Csx1 [Thermococcus sp. JdF3]NJE01392.1 TIGR01897 family CRISPR-associated protein [Thermococcus sp. JdF3]